MRSDGVLVFLWRGWGFLVPVIVVVVTFAFAVIVSLITGLFHMGQQITNVLDALAVIVGGLASAVILWFWGRRLNSDPGRVLIDPKTGEQLLFRPRVHTLFWIPMQWWSIPVAILMLILGVAMMFPTPARG
jgi:hypothetical protein